MLFNQSCHIVCESQYLGKKEEFEGLQNLRSGTPKYKRRHPWHPGGTAQVQLRLKSQAQRKQLNMGGGGGSTFDLTSSPIVYIRNIILVKILGGSPPPPFVPPALSRKSQFCARTIKSIEASHFLSIYELEPLRHAVVIFH